MEQYKQIRHDLTFISRRNKKGRELTRSTSNTTHNSKDLSIRTLGIKEEVKKASSALVQRMSGEEHLLTPHNPCVRLNAMRSAIGDILVYGCRYVFVEFTDGRTYRVDVMQLGGTTKFQKASPHRNNRYPVNYKAISNNNGVASLSVKGFKTVRRVLLDTPHPSKLVFADGSIILPEYGMEHNAYVLSMIGNELEIRSEVLSGDYLALLGMNLIP